MISVIVLNWNGKRDTLACLESLEKVTFKDFEVIVVDNGSKDDSVVAIRTMFPNIRLIETGANLGFAGGNNVGIQDALDRGAEYIYLLNNDTVVDPEILNSFMESATRHPQAGIFGSKIYLHESPNQFDHFGGFWNKKTGNFDLLALRAYDDGRWDSEQSIDYACGCSLFIRKEVFAKIGLLEPKFFLIWEEADFCFAARRAGFEVRICPKAKLWHKVSASFSSKAHSNYFWWRNRLFWIERNCTRWEKFSLWSRVLVPEIFKLFKLNFLKGIQQSISPNDGRREKIKRYRASLQGIKDYFHRRFGNAPSWIFDK